jgi:Uma2 family endonuclease
MSRTATIVGPEDHGRQMTLEEFDHAEVRDGYLYELSRGVITVSGIPKTKHFRQVDAIKQQLYLYKATHAEVIRLIGSGSECKVLAIGFESERHPDVAVYKTDPTAAESEVWSEWVPEIVIEVISPSSEKRDYEEKPPEYLAFGVAEYWIFDEHAQKVTVMHSSGGVWKTRPLGPADKITTRQLPGFELDIAAVFAAAASAQ